MFLTFIFRRFKLVKVLCKYGLKKPVALGNFTSPEVTLYILPSSILGQPFLIFGVLPSSITSLTFSLRQIKKCDEELGDIDDIQCCAKVF